MRVAIATVQVPFIRGGAENLAEGLFGALQRAGHEVDQVTLPFRFVPLSEVERSMAQWESEDFTQLNGYTPERVICLTFPTFYLQHPNKVSWMLHQYRLVYDLWGTEYGAGFSEMPEALPLKQNVIQKDTKYLQGFRHNFTIAKTVSQRLEAFNGIASTPLYHPPLGAEAFYHQTAQPYIFCPSRLEKLKRQDLLIEAMRHVRSPVVALIAGDGGHRPALQQLIEQYDLTQRVRLIGRLSDAEMRAFYAQSLAVFFAPYQEDYGYITLEAMLSQKPVITCTDAGGPGEFVIDGETGAITEPRPEAIAAAIDALHGKPQQALDWGRAGCDRYHQLNISWDNVVQQLLTA